MFQWRISKHNPRRRSKGGVRLEEWGAISDIGKLIGGRVLTLAEYLEVENRYVSAATHFVEESGLSSLQVTDIEESLPLPAGWEEKGWGNVLLPNSPIWEGQSLPLPEIERVIRLGLREILWAKLEAPNQFFIHFGHDYYVFVGSTYPCPNAIQYTKEIGLFIEPMPSPIL